MCEVDGCGAGGGKECWWANWAEIKVVVSGPDGFSAEIHKYTGVCVSLHLCDLPMQGKLIQEKAIFNNYFTKRVHFLWLCYF